MCEVPGAKGSSKIGYIKLTTFNQNATGSVKEAIKTLRGNNVKSFVLDLRNNRMGKGVIVYICDGRVVRDIYEADGANTIATSEPLVVLVNKGAASASEIIAGALKAALLFPVPCSDVHILSPILVSHSTCLPTFRKLQLVFGLSDGSGLGVTVSRYETPAHADIDKVGVIPDRPLPASFPTDEDEFCSCIRDSASPCNLDAAQLFARS